jgi:hypothetical protein
MASARNLHINQAEMRTRAGQRESGREGIDALPELAIILSLGLGDSGGGHGCRGRVLFAWPPPLRPRNTAGAGQLVNCKNAVWQPAFRTAGAESLKYPCMLKMVNKY